MVPPENQTTLLNAALANTSEGVLITDAVLDHPGPRILFANAAFCKITGYEEGELVGNTPRMLHGPRTDREELHRVRRELASRNHFHGHAINYRKDGQPFMMDWRISPVFDEVGQITHYVSIQRDVTEEHSARRDNQQAERLEAIGKVTGEIAHDFANLLVGILGFAELLNQELFEGHPSRKTATMIIETARRAQTLTRQLLAFSRTQDEERGTIDLRRAIARIEALLLQLVGEGISTKILVHDESCFVRASTTELEQIVINLVTNARDAMPEGGEILIHTRPKLLEEHETGPFGAVPGNYVELTVSDTGIGMDEDTKARIFEPFFTTKQEGQGTGLGLSNVIRHVKTLNGVIRVESQPQQGSHFRVYLPAAFSASSRQRV